MFAKKIFKYYVASSFAVIASYSYANEVLPTAEVAQKLLTDTASKFQVPSQFYDGNLVSISEISGSYYYLPRLLPDWKSYSKQVTEKCIENNDDPINVQLHVGIYDNSLHSELKSKIATQENIDASNVKLNLYPHFGRTYTLDIHPSAAVIADSTIPPKNLMNGQKLSGTTEVNNKEILNVELKCDDHIKALEKSDLNAYFHMQGYAVSESSIYLKSIASNASDLFAEIENEESEEQSTVVKQKGSSGGFKLDIGPLKIGGGRSGATTSTEIKNSRIVDRDWLANQIEKRSVALNITEVCSNGNCDLGEVRDQLVKFVLDSAKVQQVTIKQAADGNRTMQAGILTAPVQNISLDQDLDTKLKSTTTMNTNEDGEFKGAKFKKKDDTTIEFENDVVFKLKGEDWVPTSFTAHVVDKRKLNDTIEAQFTRIVTSGPALGASAQVQDIDTSQLPEKFSDGSYLDRLKANETMLSQMVNRTWKNMKSSRKINGSYKNNRNYPIEISVVGGGGGSGNKSNSCDVRIYVAGALISWSRDNWTSTARLCFATATIPPRAAYQVQMKAHPTNSGKIVYWSELQ